MRANELGMQFTRGLPQVERDLEVSIPDRLAEITRSFPDYVAICDQDRICTYAELDDLGNRYGSLIYHELGKQSEPVLLLFSDRVDALVAQISVLKSGNFYVCLDVEAPATIRNEIIAELESCLILCDHQNSQLAGDIASNHSEIKVIEVNAQAAPARMRVGELSIHQDDPAFVVYTSGSTGRPNGVMISHRNVLHFAYNQTKDGYFLPGDRVLQISPLSAAASTAETYTALLSGASLFPFEINKAGFVAFKSWLSTNRINISMFVPTTFRLLISVLEEGDRFPDMRLVRFGGDKALISDIKAFKQHFNADCSLRISYAASECLMATCIYYQAKSPELPDVVSAGLPVNGIEIFIVDEERAAINEAGKQGEIAIKSRYLSAGYWRNPTLTAERFAEANDGSGKRIYYTRDLGYLDEKGNLVLIGRLDSRVKIYGKFVSTHFVETALLELPQIKEAVVVPLHTDSGETVLKAFYVCADNTSVTQTEIRKHLLARLSRESMPRHFCMLDRMPLNKNSKIDRRRLISCTDQEL